MRLALFALVPFVFAASAGAQVFLGPSPYLQFADSPLDTSGDFVLETFEDGLFNVPGVTASAGVPYGPGGLTDSVDADDGVIDGSGVNGHSFFMAPGSLGIHFTFSPVSGELPSQAGIVWTDGSETNNVTFEAFDANGFSLGTIVANGVGDGDFNNSTAEDRFFGVQYEPGIGAIDIKSFPLGGGTGLEVDHLQFGYGPIVWKDLGHAKPGVLGAPKLVGSGPLTANSFDAFTLTNAAPSSTAHLALGIAPLDAPFKGGTMVPDPLLIVTVPTDGAGTIAVPFQFASGVPAGAGFYFQYWIQDASATLGLSASNGLLGIAQ